METLMLFINGLPAPFWAILGTCVGGSITLITTRSIKNLEYKNAFHQKLIDKRMSLYDDFSDALIPFIKASTYKGLLVPTVLLDVNVFNEAYINIQAFKSKIWWMSEDTVELYQGFCKNLKKTKHLYSLSEKLSDDELETHLLSQAKGLADWVYRLQLALQSDVLNLDKKPKPRSINYIPNLPELELLSDKPWQESKPGQSSTSQD